MEFNENKYYRVKKRTNNMGMAIFKVQYCHSFWELLFGTWYDMKSQNKTIAEAIKQIELLNKYTLFSEKTVFFKKTWKINK